jgi:hypothetical protein
MSRFNGLGLTPWTPLVFAPTKTGNTTYEVFRQYDPFADFPKYTLNALAVANSLMGYLLHFTLPVSGSAAWLSPVINVLNLLIDPISLDPASPNYIKPIVSRYEDTVYQFVPTNQLPILSPLYAVGLSRFADDLDAVVRPLIEAGYDRSVSFGVPTPAVFGLGPNVVPALQQSWRAFRQLLHPGSTPALAATANAASVKPSLIASSVNDVAPPSAAAATAGTSVAPEITRSESVPEESPDQPFSGAPRGSGDLRRAPDAGNDGSSAITVSIPDSTVVPRPEASRQSQQSRRSGVSATESASEPAERSVARGRAASR